MQEEAARYYHHFFPLLDLGLGDNPERGRHVIARRSFPSGSLLFEEDPFAVAAREGCTSTHCNHCCRPLISEPDIIACDDCAAAWYCSAGCARLDRECGWHRKECAANKDLAPRSLAVYARLVLRMLGRKQTEDLSLPFARVQFLLTHREHDPLSEMKVNQRLADTLLRYVIPAEDESQREEIVNLLCLLSCNKFIVSDNNKMEPIGVGLYPAAALINHSCDPNCVIAYDCDRTGARCLVRAIKDIPPGEELTISYIEVNQTVQARRASLQETFFFDCRCPSCESEQQGEEGPNEEGERERTLQRAEMLRLEALLCRQQGNPIAANEALIEAKELFLKCEPLQPHEELSRIALLVDLCNTYAELQQWEEAYDYCTQTLLPLERIHPPYWPAVGMQYRLHVQLALKLEGKEDQAKSSALKAVDILTTTHGGDHTLVRELKLQLEEL